MTDMHCLALADRAYVRVSGIYLHSSDRIPDTMEAFAADDRT